MPLTSGEPLISDFGAAHLGEPGQKHTGDVMPGVYRAPEIILGMEWDSKIDIWAVGVMVRTIVLESSGFPTDMRTVDLGSLRRWTSLQSHQGWLSQR